MKNPISNSTPGEQRCGYYVVHDSPAGLTIYTVENDRHKRAIFYLRADAEAAAAQWNADCL